MKRAVIVGVSADTTKFGNKALRAFLRAGWSVNVIHPIQESIEGTPCHRRPEDVEPRPDVVSVYLPPGVFLPLLPRIAAMSPAQLWLNPGTDTPEVIASALSLGLNVRQLCSIITLGFSPSDF